ncbi:MULTISPECIES: DUF1573 domain-containing protein [Maribacter]|uniref:DUF1573 domain-containing protein n=2 Tax=Maribacter TaxID=252356 RepID=A0A5B2TUZ0_9FLAO|nr:MULTISPECIES: DUF1573 domain-containing protein [Maribacter]KAA2218182.1 DUF1573 domain-containing protein [Maribacter flavus]MDC6405100.1 DUF1573 domain-containing protein [Maribacter sp. PR66]MEE1972513.1 DUF1573 domain-containing protein [Maribacter flavus]TLF45696.1 DUF1573 domain-containing protein [Maribacter aurantiacus]
MKKVVFAAGVVAMFAFTSCKENASSKIKSDNVAEAAVRDEAAKAVPVMTFEKAEHDFGTIEQGTPQETSFKFTNTGNAPLIITDAKSSCGCTVPNPPKDPIAPGESSELVVKFNGSGQNQVTKTITVTANTEKGSELLRIKAFVNPKGAAPLGPVK